MTEFQLLTGPINSNHFWAGQQHCQVLDTDRRNAFLCQLNRLDSVVGIEYHPFQTGHSMVGIGITYDPAVIANHIILSARNL